MAAASRKKRDYDEDLEDDDFIMIETSRTKKKGRKEETEVIIEEAAAGGGFPYSFDPSVLTEDQLTDVVMEGDDRETDLLLLEDPRFLLNEDIENLLSKILTYAIKHNDMKVFHKVFNLRISKSTLLKAILGTEIDLSVLYDYERFGDDRETSEFIKTGVVKFLEGYGIRRQTGFDFSGGFSAGGGGAAAAAAAAEDSEDEDNPLKHPDRLTYGELIDYTNENSPDTALRNLFILLDNPELLENENVDEVLGIVLTFAISNNNDPLFNRVFDLDLPFIMLTSAIEYSDYTIDYFKGVERFGSNAEMSEKIKKWVNREYEEKYGKKIASATGAEPREEKILALIRRYSSGASAVRLMDLPEMKEAFTSLLPEMLAKAIKTRDEATTDLLLRIDYTPEEIEKLITEWTFSGSPLEIAIRERIEPLVDKFLSMIKVRNIERLKSALIETTPSIKGKVFIAWLKSER